MKDGGAAFPQIGFITPSGEVTTADRYLGEAAGMSLRDYFAGQTLTGLLADHEVNGSPENLAKIAYAMADAMLKAREEEQ